MRRVEDNLGLLPAFIVMVVGMGLEAVKIVFMGVLTWTVLTTPGAEISIWHIGISIIPSILFILTAWNYLRFQNKEILYIIKPIADHANITYIIGVLFFIFKYFTNHKSETRFFNFYLCTLI